MASSFRASSPGSIISASSCAGMDIRSWFTNTPFPPSCRGSLFSCSTRSTKVAKRPEVTEPRTPGEHRLAQLAEPEKEVAAGTKTLVVGPYLTRKRRVSADAEGEGGNPRPPEARLDEITGLSLAIDLTIVRSLIAPLSSPRPATFIGSGKV